LGAFDRKPNPTKRAFAIMASRNQGTELSSLLSCEHGKQRREERGIQKIDLQRARRYGIREATRKGRFKFTYGGIVFIYDEKRGTEITSFPSRDLSSNVSGTKVVRPVILQKNEAYMSSKFLSIHDSHKRSLMTDHTRWTSHSVFVVDMSGSMRRDDVSGGKCRSDAVWMVLAKDFVQAQLEAKAVTGWDVVSIILMRDEAEVVIEHEPLDWILYNKLIDMREWSQSRPRGAGNYLPALEQADALLASNSLGTCALSLVFLSDGKPSDRGPFVAKTGEIASQYRRRLTFNCIGIAEAAENEAFETLHDMVSEADAFGAKSSFTAPSLNTSSLSNIISSVSSSLTSTKTEMTDLATGETRTVRQDVRSERQGTVDDLGPTEQWDLYGLTQAKSVGRIWSWSSTKDDFVILQDPRCIFCKKESINSTIQWCASCKVAAVCVDCESKMATDHEGSNLCCSLRKDHLWGKIVAMELPSFSVAVKVPIFGEGAERIVRKFRFIDQNSNFIGAKMVAKESRFIDPAQSYNKERAFHANFMRTQRRASEVADQFNEAIDDLQYNVAKEHKDWVGRLPRIKFVDPLLVEVREGIDKKHILIEQYLEGKYEKFNNNMGFVKGNSQQEESIEEKELVEEGNSDIGLGVIQEESEEEDDPDDEEYDPKESIPDPGSYSAIEDQSFAQAFSHFSFVKSRRSFMVVDLQGVFKIERDSTRKFMLTDPAIHKKNSRERKAMSDFGRTDRGRKGMRAFFRTHSCSDACRLLALQKVDPHTLQFVLPDIAS
jgi:hypothetical protein